MFNIRCLCVLLFVVLSFYQNKMSNTILNYPLISQYDFTKFTSISKIKNNSLDTLIFCEKVFNGDSYLEIITYIVKKELNYSVNKRTEYPIVISQRLNFLFRDTLLNTFLIPTNTINVKTKDNIQLQTTDVIIWKAFVLQTEKESLYCIHSTGLCNGILCPEYKGFYTLDGVIIFQDYVTDLSKIRIDSILNVYNVPPELYNFNFKKSKQFDNFFDINK